MPLASIHKKQSLRLASKSPPFTQGRQMKTRLARTRDNSPNRATYLLRQKRNVAGYAEDERLPLCGKVSSLDIITEEIFRRLFRDSRELVIIHQTERLAFNAKKRTSQAGAFFGAEDESMQHTIFCILFFILHTIYCGFFVLLTFCKLFKKKKPFC